MLKIKILKLLFYAIMLGEQEFFYE